MTLEPSDRLTTQLPPLCATQEDHDLAYRHLRRWYIRGRLPEVLDGTGDPVQDYVDILGVKR